MNLNSKAIIRDELESLKTCEYPNLKRKIGVYVDRPYYVPATGQYMCDVVTEVPALNTSESCKKVPYQEAPEQFEKSINNALTKLDAQIEELSEHRERLSAAKDSLSKNQMSSLLESVVQYSQGNVRPYKFFNFIPKTSIVKIYAFISDKELDDIEPVWFGTAIELFDLATSGHNVAGDEWSAFSETGAWLGTSEY